MRSSEISIGLIDSPNKVIEDVCEGFGDNNYPTPPVLETEMPAELERQVDQEESPDEWHCPNCQNSPCQFLQWQDELERMVDLMNPEATNNQKCYHMYRHMSRRLHGTLGKGNRRPLPLCFANGVKELYPSDWYTGYKPNPFESGPCGERDRDDKTI